MLEVGYVLGLRDLVTLTFDPWRPADEELEEVADGEFCAQDQFFVLAQPFRPNLQPF